MRLNLVSCCIMLLNSHRTATDTEMLREKFSIKNVSENQARAGRKAGRSIFPAGIRNRDRIGHASAFTRPVLSNDGNEGVAAADRRYPNTA
ncbi:hypothetical protein RHECNPAF_770086 [Rhizobium etli CNPAF512]|nr:hypothetical protein RHECNPAF_770086 [Rhizobium etli CNPAF512]